MRGAGIGEARAEQALADRKSDMGAGKAMAEPAEAAAQPRMIQRLRKIGGA